jgi:hypothetical protein
VRALASLAFALAGIHVGGHRVMPIGYAPAWSPDARRIAFVTKHDLWVADADGTHRALLVPNADEPVWAPDGRHLAFTRGGWIYTVRADGDNEHQLTRGAHPTWSHTGERIAFDRDGEIYRLGWFGGGLRHVATGTDPAYAPNGELAYVQDGEIIAGTRTIDEGQSPTWSPSSRQVAYEKNGEIFIDGRRITKGFQPAWMPRVGAQELLPDFDERPPAGLAIAGATGYWKLGFTSLVDNVGLGPSVIVGERGAGQPRMNATQRVELSNHRWRTYDGVGRLRYTSSPPHHHWHLMKFVTFTLRTLTGDVVVSDRKSGFCLADHWGTAPGKWPNRRPHFLGDCRQYDPQATSVIEGTSVGYTDRYPAFFHGQNVDITHVKAGVYDLVHRTNANMLLHELRYENDAASLRIRVTWRAGTPRVTVLRSCPSTPRC